MNDSKSRAAQRANSLFRREAQKLDGAVAWREYTAQEEATRRKTARLRELRVARDASAVPQQPSKKAALRRA